MEEEQHAQRHAQFQSVVEVKMKEATELRGCLDDIVLTFNSRSVLKRLVKEVCRSAVVTPTVTDLLVGLAFSDVGGFLGQEPSAPDMEQVERLTTEMPRSRRGDPYPQEERGGKDNLTT